MSYAPFYLAEVRGLFAAQGLEVDMVLSASPTETAEGLIAGRADVAFGGPMRVMMHHDRDRECTLRCFCQVVGPEPFVLLGATARPQFRLRDLEGLRVGVVSEVPTPWLTLQDDLAREGLDPAALEQAPARTMAENVAALAAGSVDVIQVMEPYTELAIAGGAHIWHEAARRGNVGFTTFYAPRAFVEDRRDACVALTRAVQQAVTALYAMAPRDIAELLAPRFPDLSPVSLQNSLERYRRIGIWSTRPELTAAEFVRLKAALLSGGFIQRDVPFEQVVVNFAELSA